MGLLTSVQRLNLMRMRVGRQRKEILLLQRAGISTAVC